MPSIPLLFEYSPSCIVFGIGNAIALCTKYLQLFVSFTYATPPQTVVGDALGVWTLGSVAGNRSRPRMHLLPLRIVSKQNPALPYFRQRGAKGTVQRVKQDPRHQAPSSTCEASSRAVAAPAAVEPAPEHDHAAIVLDEVRDVEAAAAVLHDRRPQEHRLAAEELAEDLDALLLDFLAVAQTEAGLERVGFLEVVVDAVADHDALLLVVVEPLLDRCEVVLGRSRTFQFGVHHLLHPVGIDGTDRAVNTDDGVEWDFGFRRRGFPFHDNEFACQKARYGGFTANLVENRLDL